MFNKFFIVGEIKQVQVSKQPADPNKSPSALVLIQYGQNRESTGGMVEFVNAVQVRVPGYRYATSKDFLVVGKRIQVEGRLQGVFRSVMDSGHFVTELVAESVRLTSEQPSASSSPAHSEA
jgi:acetaldehyde dehydrogenase (acetylating)